MLTPRRYTGVGRGVVCPCCEMHVKDLRLAVVPHGIKTLMNNGDTRRPLGLTNFTVFKQRRIAITVKITLLCTTFQRNLLMP